ncbi:hypothetical protein ACFFRR_007036 [Megaselia abdita]
MLAKKTLFPDILKNADLENMTSKKVRLELETEFDCKLISRKKEIDKMVVDFINSRAEDEEDDEEPEPTPPPKKKKKAATSEEESQEEISSDEDKPRKRRAAKKEPKKAPRKKAEGSGKGKGNGFTRPYTLSPELSALMGAEALPRHEVVKKVWAIIKERNLYDPKNKQFAICDADLHKVMGVKRFRTFGMLKFLKPHFLD